MALENLVGADKFISNLVPSNPTSGDDKREGDDHLRGVKNVLKNTFPNLNGAVPLTPAEMGSVTSKVNKAGDVMTGALQFSTGGVVGAEIKSGGNWLAFGTGAATPTERVRIDADGNVMLGATAPGNAYSGRGLLELNGSTDVLFGLRVANTNTGYLHASPTGVNLYAEGSRNLVFGTGNAERMRVDAIGRVGIGVTPQYPFDIFSDDATVVRIRKPSSGFETSLGTTPNSSYLNAGNTDLSLHRNGVERLRVKSDGVYAEEANLTNFNARSVANPGYIRLPFGIYIQWGGFVKATASTVQAVTFPTPFPNGCWTVTLSDSGSGGWVQRASAITKNGFTNSCDTWNAGANPSNVGVCWFAIGN